MNCILKVNKKNFMLNFLNILFLGILFFFFFYSKKSETLFSNPEYIVYPWVVSSLIIHIINFKFRKYKLYDFGMWYILVSYIFLFGLVFREVFSLNYSLEWNPIKYYSNTELFNSYFFSLIALNCFSTGYFMSKKIDLEVKYNNDENLNKKAQMFSLGLILALIGGICMLINDLRVISILKTYNSYLGYKYVNGGSILDDLAYMFLPGLFLIFFSDKLSTKQKKYIFLITIIYFVIVMMLTGSRKIKLFSIISLFLGYVFSSDKKTIIKKKIKLSKILLYCLSGLLLLNIMVTIRDNRFELSNTIPVFLDNLLNMNFLKDVFGEVFSETGLTLLSISSIMRTVPSVFPFEYGLTFIKTIPSFLPIGWLVGDFFNGASSTNVINTYLDLPLGSSMIGDLYWNFGLIGGFISAFVFGILFAKLFNVDQKQNSSIGKAIYFCLFSQLIILVRAEFFDIFRPLIMVVVIAFILNKTSFPMRGVKLYEKK